jgi:hypothetical protein
MGGGHIVYQPGTYAGDFVRGDRGKVIGSELALELLETFLHAQFSEVPRHQRHLAKVKALETGNPNHDDQHPHT